MSLLVSKTKWLWILLALYSGPTLSPVRCISVKVQPKSPSTIETQAKFFQDFFSVQLSPYKIEFGHVCEDPNSWEQRYEKKDYKNHRDMGKVRWGDKKGGYGEHYWDLNHAGHTDKHGDDDYSGHSNSDDGSYHEQDHDIPNSSYESPSDHSYGSDDYDPEKGSYEENGRAKRAHPRQKQEKRHKITLEEEEESRPKNKKYKEQPQAASSHTEEYFDDGEESEEVYKKPKRRYHKPTKQPYKQYENDDYGNNNDEDEEEIPDQRDAKKQVVLVVKEKEEESNPTKSIPAIPKKQVDSVKYVPYEDGAGLRQHYQQEATAAASVPRLFLEPTTGHVVDRATGQAYVLQPVATYKPN